MSLITKAETCSLEIYIINCLYKFCRIITSYLIDDINVYLICVDYFFGSLSIVCRDVYINVISLILQYEGHILMSYFVYVV